MGLELRQGGDLASCFHHVLKLLLKKNLIVSRERGEGREKGERNISVSIGCLSHAPPPLGTWSAAHACALAGNQIGDLPVCRPVLGPLSHCSRGPALLCTGTER